MINFMIKIIRGKISPFAPPLLAATEPSVGEFDPPSRFFLICSLNGLIAFSGWFLNFSFIHTF